MKFECLLRALLPLSLFEHLGTEFPNSVGEGNSDSGDKIVTERASMTRRAVDYIKQGLQSASSDCMRFKRGEGWKSNNMDAAVENTEDINSALDLRIKNQFPLAFLS